MMEPVYFLCFDLSFMSRTSLFLVLTTITFALFILYSFIQELISNFPEFEGNLWFLTLIQFFFYSVFGYTESVLRNDRERKIPMNSYVLLALLQVTTIGFSNASVGHLNYPTMIMFKCCKLIPVLIGGILIQGKKFNIYDWIASIAMSLGLIFFTLADVQVQPSFKPFGVFLISIALCADAIIGNLQEKLMKAFKSSEHEVILYSCSIGFIYILIGQLLFGDISGSFDLWIQNPSRTFGYAFVFSLAGYLGINIVLQLVKHFGALMAVTITTCRKAITIVISFIFFYKPFTPQYGWAGLLVLLGIYLNLFSKNRDKWEQIIKNTIDKILSKKKKDDFIMSSEL